MENIAFVDNGHGQCYNNKIKDGIRKMNVNIFSEIVENRSLKSLVVIAFLGATIFEKSASRQVESLKNLKIFRKLLMRK